MDRYFEPDAAPWPEVFGFLDGVLPEADVLYEGEYEVEIRALFGSYSEIPWVRAICIPYGRCFVQVDLWNETRLIVNIYVGEHEKHIVEHVEDYDTFREGVLAWDRWCREWPALLPFRGGVGEAIS